MIKITPFFSRVTAIGALGRVMDKITNAPPSCLVFWHTVELVRIVLVLLARYTHREVTLLNDFQGTRSLYVNRAFSTLLNTRVKPVLPLSLHETRLVFSLGELALRSS